MNIERRNVKIISDGTPEGTRVQVGDERLNFVTKIEINPIEPNKDITAKLTVLLENLEIDLDDMSIECADPAAEYLLNNWIMEQKKQG
jgi:hypothetical protein